MDRAGKNLRALSPFENFEWDPVVANDGRIVYARWDYVDRDNMPYMSLWSTNPDGTNPQLVYGNHTRSPYGVFEARPIPGSRKLVFTTRATVEYDQDFLMDGATMYAYFRTKNVVASDFHIERMEQQTAALLNAVMPMGDSFGQKLLADKLRDGFTVIRGADGGARGDGN